MSKTLKIVHICNHIIKQSSEINLDAVVTRSSDKDYDVIDSINTVSRIASVHNNTVIYGPNLDYSIFTHNKIKWVGLHYPNPGDTYTVNYDIININNILYDQSSCPRCNGDGWYTGIIDDDTSMLYGVIGIEKLVQDFMKILLTSKSVGTGTDLISLAGREMHSENEMSNIIVTIIRDAEAQYKSTQLQMVSAGTPLPDDEKLYMVDIADIEFNGADFGFVLSLGIINFTSNNASINIKI